MSSGSIAASMFPLGFFGLAVTSGWWSPGVAFLTFPASVLLEMGGGSPPLSFFTVHFHILGVHSCGFSPDLRGPRFTRPALCSPRISPVDVVPPPPLSSLLRMGVEVLVTWVSAGLAVLSSLPAFFVLPALFFRRGTCFLYVFFFIYYSI